MSTVCMQSELSTVIASAAASLRYSKLKPKQYKTVKEFMSGKDVFECLPTGSGKSLCYAVLPTVFNHLRQKTSPTSLVIVVSPLITLIKDQVETFMRKGLKPVYVSSDEDSKHAVLTGGFNLSL